ncbi:MAG: hypothetical protein LC114_23365 [Bryobacterales bacterium]|nr:hypothetical protein [Bryobacterales bacterium]
MDELYQEIKRFIAQLGTFNTSTAKNWDALQQAWESAAELWTDDETRNTFENDWGEMAVALRVYRERYAERYEEFLMQRKMALDEYYGRR